MKILILSIIDTKYLANPTFETNYRFVIFEGETNTTSFLNIKIFLESDSEKTKFSNPSDSTIPIDVSKFGIQMLT